VLQCTLLTVHEHAEGVAVVVREVVAEQLGPVSGDEVEGGQQVGLGVPSAHTQRPVHQLQQTAPLGERRLGLAQPLGQVKLGGMERHSTCQLVLFTEYLPYILSLFTVHFYMYYFIVLFYCFLLYCLLFYCYAYFVGILSNLWHKNLLRD